MAATAAVLAATLSFRACLAQVTTCSILSFEWSTYLFRIFIRNILVSTNIAFSHVTSLVTCSSKLPSSVIFLYSYLCLIICAGNVWLHTYSWSGCTPPWSTQAWCSSYFIWSQNQSAFVVPEVYRPFPAVFFISWVHCYQYVFADFNALMPEVRSLIYSCADLF